MIPNPRIAAAAGILWLLSGLCLHGCAEEEPDPEVIPFELALGTWDRALGDFRPLEAGTTQPLIAGFQGLLFVNLALLTSADIEPRQRARVDVGIVGLGEEYSFNDNQVYFEQELLPDGTAVLVVPSFRIPFERAPEELDGDEVRVSILVGLGEALQGRAEGSFRVADADNCIHLPTDEIVCE
jgi:hypothetical protein